MLFGNFTESQSKDFSKEAIGDGDYAEDYGYSSDSDLEDDEDEKVVSFNHAGGSKVHPSGPSGVPGEGGKIPCEECKEHVERGKVVKISDTAFVT